MSTTIGRDIEAGQTLIIGDNERRSGLYILGKPRMGKSWLMVHLILQDIKNGHGVFFLDPHGDAIDELMRYGWFFSMETDCLLFDPENPLFTFIINILACEDIASAKARADTFTSAKGVFDKLWKKTFDEKPWLQLILQNTIYAFIENQGYTLAEFPLFFRDAAFRAFIVNNMQYNDYVRDYWTQTFSFQKQARPGNADGGRPNAH